MASSQVEDIGARFRQRAAAILRTEGLAGLARRATRRLKSKPRHENFHVVALSLPLSTFPPPPEVEVEISPVEGEDSADLDVLAEIDVWSTSKAHLLRRLEEGQQCYVARYEGQIVSSGWWKEEGFLLPSLGRRFRLASGEIYVHNAQTVPAFRGKGIYPYLRAQSLDDLVRTQGTTRAVAFIKATNRSSLRCWAKMGGCRVGRAGFVEILGLRFHYLVGRSALRNTRRRFFVERR